LNVLMKRGLFGLSTIMTCSSDAMFAFCFMSHLHFLCHVCISFLTCGFFGQIWQLVCNWLRVHSTDPSNIVDHFLQFGTSSGHAKSRCSFMFLIWFASSWVIWKERNARFFQGTENSPSQLLESIKLLSFSWYKANFVVFHYQFHAWCRNPFLCLGIG